MQDEFNDKCVYGLLIVFSFAIWRLSLAGMLEAVNQISVPLRLESGVLCLEHQV